MAIIPCVGKVDSFTSEELQETKQIVSYAIELNSKLTDNYLDQISIEAEQDSSLPIF